MQGSVKQHWVLIVRLQYQPKCCLEPRLPSLQQRGPLCAVANSRPGKVQNCSFDYLLEAQELALRDRVRMAGLQRIYAVSALRVQHLTQHDAQSSKLRVVLTVPAGFPVKAPIMRQF